MSSKDPIGFNKASGNKGPSVKDSILKWWNKEDDKKEGKTKKKKKKKPLSEMLTDSVEKYRGK